MKLCEVREILGAQVFCGEAHLDLEIHSAFASDFMSDVLAFVNDQGLLLTGMVNPQVIRTAEMMDIRCIVFVRGKAPGEDVVALARLRDMVLMSTPLLMFSSCGLLYAKGLPGQRDANA